MLKLFQKILPDIVTININSKNISFAWFQSKKNNQNILKKYERFEIQDYFIHNLEIYNINKFTSYLNSFIKSNKLQNPFVYISLEGNEIIEEIVDEPQTALSYTYIINSQEILINNKKYFYITKIKHSTIFQYKLFAIQSKINLSKIVSGNFINFQTLKNYKPIFLENIINTQEIQYNFNNFIESCDIQNYMVISDNSINIKDEKQFLMKNIGTFLLKDFS